VVDGVMLGAAVVPDREGARGPAHPAGELGPRLVSLQEVDERAALVLAHVLEADRVASAHVQRLAPGVGMRAHRGMLGFVLVGVLGVLDLHAADGAVHLAAATPVLEAGAVHADQAPEEAPHALGERVVRGMRARKEGIAPVRGCLDRLEKRGERRLREIGGVGMPVAAEIRGLLLFLHHLEDVWVALQAGDKWIEAGLAKAAAHAHQVGSLERLVAKHEHRVAQKRAMDRLPGRILPQTRQRDSANLRSHRAGQSPDYHYLRLWQNTVRSSGRASWVDMSGALSRISRTASRSSIPGRRTKRGFGREALYMS